MHSDGSWWLCLSSDEMEESERWWLSQACVGRVRGMRLGVGDAELGWVALAAMVRNVHYEQELSDVSCCGLNGEGG